MSPFEAALKGSRRDRLHHHLDHGLAGRGVHPGAAHGRRRRAHLQRVRRGGDDRDRRLGVRLADADADARGAPAGGARRDGDAPQEEPVRARLRPGAARATRVLLDLCLRFRVAGVPGLPRHGRGDRLAVRDDPEGLLPAEDIGQLSVSTEARQDISFPAMVDLQQRGRGRSSSARRMSRMCALVVGGGRVHRHDCNTGRLFVELKPKGQRRDAAEGARRPAPRARPGSPASQRSSRRCRTCARRPRRRRASTSSSCRASNQAELDRLGEAAGGRAWAATPRPSPTSPPTSQNNALQATLDDRPRQGQRARHHRRPAALDALQRLRHPAGLDHLRDRRQLPGDRRVRPGARTGPPTGSTIVRIRAGNGKLVPLSAFARSSARRGRSPINQLGQLPAVTISFNLPARRVARRRRPADRRHQGASSACRRTIIDHLRRHRARCSRTRSPTRACSSLAARDHDLHRARHPLRELHPPADHPDRPAGGGGRRAAARSSCSASTLSVIAIIGILMLIGIVKKNAIMMIDVALVRQRDGASAAARRSARPACCASARS